jgi:hypothetical protein
MDDLMKFFHARKAAYRTAARRFDEAIYTPYTYDLSASHTQTASVVPSDRDVIKSTETAVFQLNVPESGEDRDATSPIDTRSPEVKQRISRFHNQQPEGESDVFLFDYGVVAILRRMLALSYLSIIDGRDVGNDGSPREAVFIIDVGIHEAIFWRLDR